MDEASIFLEALQKSSPDERAAFLDQACGGNDELRRSVELLLRAHDKAGSFLADAPAPVGVTVDQPLTERPGTVIGPYKLLEPIGEGGMGSVWMAQQTEPVKRLVAVKLIKPGMDSKQVIARFEAERQALALMDHPNIAKVLDGGTSGAGRPYFVMDLVKGVPITKYCDEHHLTPRQRLELFVPVCQAVQHAHQKGIIHRDLKPSNVLVAPYDGKPVVKVIDFGVAKAAGQPLTDKTLVTGFGSIVGTLEYMSPEQAELNNHDIDTRSDIYALGVLLYELLTGSPPFSRKDLEKAGMLEMLRVIREQEPSKPSTKLSTAEGLPTLAANRGTEPAKLTKLVRGELDWIVMKALEKDRNRRYETANGFALDVQRYLADEPVQACPPSASYRLRKFVRRNKAALATAGLVLFFIVLLGGIVGWGMRDRAAREHEIAQETARKLVLTEQGIRQALDRAATSRGELHGLLKKPGGVQQLLNQPAGWELFIKTAQGELAQARRLAVRAEGSLDVALTQAIDQFEQQLTSDQADYDLALRLEKVALDHATLVNNRFDHRGLIAEYPKAFARFGVLNDDPEVVADRLTSSPIREQLVAGLDEWAFIAFVDSNKALAERLLTLVRHVAPDPTWGDRLRQITVWNDQQALEKLVAQAPAAGLSPRLVSNVGERLRIVGSPLAESWLRRGQVEHPADFWLNFNLAHALQKTNPAEAAGFYRAALAVRPGSSAVYNNLGQALREQKKLSEAIACYHKAIDLAPKEAAVPYFNLGIALHAQEKRAEAINAYQKAIDLKTKEALESGRGQELYAGVYFNLGNVLREQQKLPEAIDAYRKAVELDPKHANGYVHLGVALAAAQKPAEAIDAYRKAIELDRKNTAAHCNLGVVLYEQGKLDEAIDAYHTAIELDPNDATVYRNLGLALRKKGKQDDCIAAYREAIKIDPKFVEAHYELGTQLCLQNKLDEGITSLRTAVELAPKHVAAHENLAVALLRTNQTAAAIRHFQKATELEPNCRRHSNLARLLATCPDPKLRDPRLAVEHAKKAVELQREDNMAWQVLGWAQYRAGAWRESIEALEKSCKLETGGDCGQWIVLALAHAKLAAEEGLTEKEREHHKLEARRRYEDASKQIDAWGSRPGDSMRQAIWDFRIEAKELMAAKDGKK